MTALKMLSSMATRELLASLAAQFELDVGQRVVAEAGGGVDIARRISAGEPADVVVLASNAIDKLIAVGYDPVYGARPLKRAIRRWIENPLAQRILAGDFAPGAVVQAKVEGDEIVFA